MKKAQTALVTLGLAGLVHCASAQGLGSSFGLNPGATIPDGNPVGWMGQFNVTGASGQVSGVQVTLDITGGYNGDLYAYLVSPQGQRAVLLNRPGISGTNPFGYGDSGLAVTFDMAAAKDVHSYGLSFALNSNGQVTGTWAADGRDIDPQSDGHTFDSAPTTGGLNLLSGLAGADMNGAWTLFLADCAVGGGAATLQAVGMQISTVPEPSIALQLVGSIFAWRLCRWHCRTRN